MLFSSLTFRLYFLPAVVLIHFFLPKKCQNGFLLGASLLFYSWGDARRVPLFMGLLLADWGVGLALGRAKKPAARKGLLALGLCFSFGALIFYKYTGFLLGAAGIEAAFTRDLTLPLGISFFTFQAAGYLIDVYRGASEPEKSPVSFGTFLFLFPQLIAGPIVRYHDLAPALHARRRPDGRALDGGMALFAAGLAAKALLANPLGEAYQAFRAVGSDMGAAWLSLAAYTGQIYFDFLGYSVMAVGIGRMLGFSFPRNFRDPYAATTVTDFWRRWHITLGGWFRDYVYIPLGGSRRGQMRTVLNLLAVWALTGFWHGADWTFLLWGLWYFVLLTAEKFLVKDRLPRALHRLLTLLSVMLGWALFVSDGLVAFGDYLSGLFCFRFSGPTLFWLREYAVLFVIAAAFCVPWTVKKLKALSRRSPVFRWAAALALLTLCLAALARSTYNPFLYFRF